MGIWGKITAYLGRETKHRDPDFYVRNDNPQTGRRGWFNASHAAKQMREGKGDLRMGKQSYIRDADEYWQYDDGHTNERGETIRHSTSRWDRIETDTGPVPGGREPPRERPYEDWPGSGGHGGEGGRGGTFEPWPGEENPYDR